MTTRRNFIRTSGLTAAALAMTGTGKLLASSLTELSYVSKRPAPDKRNFTSKAVEKAISATKAKLKDPKLAWMFENCFPNTLDTTVEFKTKNGKPDTFVITGDIHAMWLRDSSAQVWPYLPLVNQDENLKSLIAGVINRQTQCVIIDPYANSFNEGPTGSEWMTDETDMKPELHERKWEIDSLCYTVRLAYHYWKTTGDTSVFDADWQKAAASIVQTFTVQQRKDGLRPYKFQRKTTSQLDTVSNHGYGRPLKPVGLINSSFRPSDDCATYGFLIPSNFPSLLALPYLGCVDLSDPIYQNTRKLIWSEDNPYFFKGKAAEGIGGPHVGYDMVWPMSIIMRAMTSSDDKEIAWCVKTLRDTDAGTGFMHETFHKDDPTNFTRKWFAWANTLFGELVLKLVNAGKL